MGKFPQSMAIDILAETDNGAIPSYELAEIASSKLDKDLINALLN